MTELVFIFLLMYYPASGGEYLVKAFRTEQSCQAYSATVIDIQGSLRCVKEVLHP